MIGAFNVPVAHAIIKTLEAFKEVKRAAVTDHWDEHRGRVAVAVVQPKAHKLVDTEALRQHLLRWFAPPNVPTYVVLGRITRKARRDFDRLVEDHRARHPDQWEA